MTVPAEIAETLATLHATLSANIARMDELIQLDQFCDGTERLLVLKDGSMALVRSDQKFRLGRIADAVRFHQQVAPAQARRWNDNTVQMCHVVEVRPADAFRRYRDDCAASLAFLAEKF